MTTQRTTMTLKEFRTLIRPNAVFTCVTNTFRPELNGQERIITTVQTNGWYWIVSTDTAEQPKRFWTDMPTAREILSATSNGFGLVTVTMSAKVEGMTLTLEFEAPLEVNS